MEILSSFAPREAGLLVQEPHVTFSDADRTPASTQRCPITACDYTCMGTGNTS